jgi:hypothetical protein
MTQLVSEDGPATSRSSNGLPSRPPKGGEQPRPHGVPPGALTLISGTERVLVSKFREIGVNVPHGCQAIPCGIRDLAV